MCERCFYPGQKNRFRREIHEVDRRSDHVISCDIELRFDGRLTATRLTRRYTHNLDTGHLHVDTEGRTHECSSKSRILAGRYHVPDVVFPKHGPTFCPRLWSSTMLLRGGTRRWILRSRQCKGKGKGKGNYLTSVAKQAKTAFLHGPTV